MINKVKHNHHTRNIKEIGKCPACDLYHKRRFQKLQLENTVLKEKLEIAESQIEDLIESYTNLQKQLSVDFQYQEIERLKSELSVAESKIEELQSQVAYCENP